MANIDITELLYLFTEFTSYTYDPFIIMEIFHKSSPKYYKLLIIDYYHIFTLHNHVLD